MVGGLFFDALVGQPVKTGERRISDGNKTSPLLNKPSSLFFTRGALFTRQLATNKQQVTTLLPNIGVQEPSDLEGGDLIARKKVECVQSQIKTYTKRITNRPKFWSPAPISRKKVYCKRIKNRPLIAIL